MNEISTGDKVKYALLGASAILVLWMTFGVLGSLIAVLGGLLWLAMVCVALFAFVDLMDAHRKTGEPWGSVDILWAAAFIAFHFVAPIVWFLWGRNVRRRELEEAAARRGSNEPVDERAL